MTELALFANNQGSSTNRQQDVSSFITPRSNLNSGLIVRGADVEDTLLEQ